MNNQIFSDKGGSVIRATFRTDSVTAVESAIKPRYMKTRRIISLLAVIMIAAVSPVTWAAGHGGSGGVIGGSHFGGGSHVGGFAGGVSRSAPAFSGRGFRTTPAFQGAYFTGRSIVGVSKASHPYYKSAAMPAITSHGVSALSNQPTRIADRTSTIRGQQDRAELQMKQSAGVANSQAVATNRQSNRTGSIAVRNRISAPRPSTAVNRQSFVKNHASEQHDANNWHRDWDRHHAHFHYNRVYVFINGFWWGLYPWNYYPYYASGYPYDYDNNYPYGYYDGSPDSYNGYPSYDDQQPGYDSDQYGIGSTISAVQSELAKLGYYHGAIDGVVGDETEASLARYQQDHDLSVTGTLTTATLQSLGLPQSVG